MVVTTAIRRRRPSGGAPNAYGAASEAPIQPAPAACRKFRRFSMPRLPLRVFRIRRSVIRAPFEREQSAFVMMRNVIISAASRVLTAESGLPASGLERISQNRRIQNLTHDAGDLGFRVVTHCSTQ